MNNDPNDPPQLSGIYDTGEPLAPQASQDTTERPLTVLCEVSDQVEGKLVVGLLSSEGIEAMLSSEVAADILPLGTSDSPSVLVLERDLDRAQQILEERRVRSFAVAIVLAAGEGQRMGQPKALLSVGEQTLVESVVDAYEASVVREVIVVVAPGSAAAEKLAGGSVTVVENPEPDRGPLSSLWAALDELQGEADAILLHPVDVPVFETALIDELVRRYDAGEGPILVPTYEGRRGHPVLFGKACFPLLREAPLEVGARHVLHEHPELVREVPTDQRWVVVDLNTPAELERFLQEGPTGNTDGE